MERDTDGIISNYKGTAFECIDPPGGSIIIHAANFRNGLDKVKQVHSALVQAFPNNLVISIPNTDSVDCLDKQSTIEFLQSMISVIQGEEIL